MGADSSAIRYLLDSYLDWSRAEGPPLYEGAFFDAATAQLRPWPRLGEGVAAGFAHLAGRGDFLGLQAIEIAQGGATRPGSHLFDEIYFVLSGRGELRVEGEAPVAFARRALFSPPVNRPFSLAATSSGEATRVVCVNNLPFQMNFFREARFLFDNPYPPAATDIVTHFISDLDKITLQPSPARGPGYASADLAMGQNSLNAHIGALPAGAYAKARRHGPGAHILPFSGEGYSLVYTEDGREFERLNWRPGLVLAPADDRFIQHFNVGAAPARILSLSLGNRQRPLLARRQTRFANADLSIDAGGTLLDFAQQPAAVHPMFEDELRRKGLKSHMGSPA